MHWTVDIFSDWNETVQTSVLEGRLSRFVMAVPMQDQLLVLASRVSCGPAGQRCIVQRQEDICWWNMMKYDQIQNCFQQKLGAVFSRSCECIYEVLIRLYTLNIWSLLPAVSKTCFICGRWPSNICRLFSTTLHCSINRIPYIPILLLHSFLLFFYHRVSPSHWIQTFFWHREQDRLELLALLQGGQSMLHSQQLQFFLQAQLCLSFCCWLMDDFEHAWAWWHGQDRRSLFTN